MNRTDIALDLACKHNEELKQSYLAQADRIIRENEVIVLFTTDIHAETGKLHYVKERLVQLQGEGRNALLVDSGDINEKTKDITDYLNGYWDCVTAGNHDALCNGATFYKRVDEANFTYLAYDLVRNGEPVLTPYRIFDFGGIRLGIIGQSRIHTSSGKWDAKVERSAESFQKWIDEMDADYIIALIHMGEDECRKYLKQLHGIDAVLGGHTHKKVNTILKDRDGNDVIFAQAGVRMNCYGEMAISDTIKVELKGV